MKTPSPPSQIRDRLADARAAERDFDEAWPWALIGLEWTNRGPARHEWLEALEETREQWRAAYEREPPTRALEAAGQLPDLIGAT